MHTKCGRERVGNSVQMDVRKVTAVNGHHSELAEHGFLMPEQRFPKCVPRIHDQFPGDKCVHFSRVYFGKGEAVPIQAWTSPGGSRKLRFPDFMRTVPDGGRMAA